MSELDLCQGVNWIVKHILCLIYKLHCFLTDCQPSQSCERKTEYISGIKHNANVLKVATIVCFFSLQKICKLWLSIGLSDRSVNKSERADNSPHNICLTRVGTE